MDKFQTPQLGSKHPLFSISLWMFILLVFFTIGCRLTSQVVSESTVTPTLNELTYVTSQTPLPSQTLVATFANSPTPTLTPVIVPTRTAKPTLIPLTFTPTPSKLPPTFTPTRNKLTAGYQVWTLENATVSPTLTVWDNTFFSTSYTPGNNWGYQFLRLDFECTTRASLTGLLTGGEQGITLLQSREGYPYIYFRDRDGVIYPVQFISTCWLAGEVDPRKKHFKLHFLSLTPLPISVR